MCRTPAILAAFAITVGGGAVRADDPEARRIMVAVDERDDGDHQTSDLEMILIDKKKKRRVRRIRSFSRDQGEDTQQIMFFLAPADVKDTGFLTYDFDDVERDDDQWLYLPALRKVKRIAAGDQSGSFMGSDFNYADMTTRPVERYDYEVMKETRVGEHPVWQIQAVPRSGAEAERTGYTKSVLFVRQDNYVVIRGVSWLERGDRLRYMDVRELVEIDGIWVATEVHMTTKQGKATQHKTILKRSNVRFGQDLAADLFTLRQLEKGP